MTYTNAYMRYSKCKGGCVIRHEWMPWRKISYISTRHGRFGWLLFEHYVNEKHLTHTYANRIWATVYGQKFIRSIVKQLHSIWHRIALLPYSFLSFIFFFFYLCWYLARAIILTASNKLCTMSKSNKIRWFAAS